MAGNNRSSSIVDEALAGFANTPEALEAREALLDPNFAAKSAVSKEQGNTFTAEDTLANDLLTGSYDELVVKYGTDIARQSIRSRRGLEEYRITQEESRDIGTSVVDNTVAAASALYRDIGNVGILAYAYGRQAFDKDFDGSEAAAELLFAHGQIYSEIQKATLSNELKKNQFYWNVEGELDRKDNALLKELELSEGADPFMADLKETGRNFLDAGSRTLQNPAIASNLIADGIGSLIGSAPLAGAGGLIAKGATKAVTRNIVAQRVAQATAISAAAGSTEVAGVYAEAVSDVMSIPVKQLAEVSPVFQELLSEGLTPEEARVQLAGMTAEIAAIRQIPPTLALGYITSRFEAMPIGSFRNVGVTKGLLQIAGEGIEEAGQGATGTINRNLAVEEYANIGRAVLDGVGEEAAIGAIAGMGTAGAAATPATISGGISATAQGAVQAANALFSETTYNDPVRQDLYGGSVAGNAIRTVAQNAGPVINAAKKAGAVAGAIAQPAVDAVERFNNRDENTKLTEEIKIVLEASPIVDEAIANQSFSPEMTKRIANEDAVPSAGFSDSIGSNIVSTVGNIITQLQDSKFKPTTEDTLFAAQQIATLKGVANSLPVAIRRQVAKLATSKAAEKVLKEAAELDLNTQEVAPEQEVSTAINVARTNPANMKPETASKILKESGDQISEEDSKFLRVASKVSEAINTVLGDAVNIRQGKAVGLEAVGRKENNGTAVDNTSRQILAEGYTSRKGKSLRSLNDFASDIIQGLQSPDGTIINQNKEVVPVRQVAEQFAMFLEHMNNRVEALNRSFDNNGSNEKFRMLVDGDTWVDPNNWSPGARAVFYHKNNKNSVETAQRVEQDRDTAIVIYDAISKEFPGLFEGITVPEPIALKKVTDTPTAIEAEETEVSSNENVSDSTNDVEADPVTDENVLSVEQLSEVDQPTGIDDVTDSSTETIEEEATADNEIEEGGELVTEEPILAETKWTDLVSLMTSEEKARIAKNVKPRLLNARNFIKEVMPPMNKHVRTIRIVPLRYKDLGRAFYDDQSIYLREDMFNKDNTLTNQGRAVAIHEVGHLVDAYENPVGVPYSNSRMFYKGGEIFNEMNALRGKLSKFFNRRLEYAFSRPNIESIASELFAVATEMVFTTEDIKGDLGYTAAMMEEVYGNLIRTEATGTSLEVSETEIEEDAGEGDGESVVTADGDTTGNAGSPRSVNPEFDRVFPRDENSVAPETVADLQQSAEGQLNPIILEAVSAMAPIVLDAMNKRLKKVRTKIENKTASVSEHLKDGRIQNLSQYRMTTLVDPQTGQYNENMIQLAMVAMVDWLSVATPSDPGRIEDNLEKQGLSFADITDDQVKTMAFGIAPPVLKAQLSRDILRMWGVIPNNASKMAEVHGIAQSLASEMLLMMDQEFDYFEVQRVKLAKTTENTDSETGVKEVVNVETDSVVLNMEKVREFQQQVRDAKVVGVTDSAKDFLFKEKREKYSIGFKLNSKPNPNLSTLENKAVKTMEDTPHYKDEGRSNLFFNLIGEDNLKKLFGYVEGITEETVPNGVLRRSYLGKNLSVENDIRDAQVLTSSVENESQPVYYPVDVTSVGRHQYQGVNPQSNKVLRALVTPTWATVDIETQEDAVWLGIAQASDLHKIEKKNHTQILSTIRDDFEKRYGEAKNQVLNALRGEPFDAEAFTISALGDEDSVGPQILAAIETVAKMQHAKETGQSTFESSLSVELDGLTNGAANMMVNFGQGLMSASEWQNFKRIGFYIGKVGQTINDFFEQEGNLDMYETVARLAQEKMNLALKNNKIGYETAAARNIAGHFGDFKMNPKTGQFEMTRNSAKNPMTKVNYGSGVLGVGTGLADDIILKLYEALHMDDLANIPYAGDLRADFAALGINIPAEPSASWQASKADIAAFRKSISMTIGKALTEAAKETLGDKISEVNDMLVFSTNVQAAYLNEMFNIRMESRAEELAAEGKIRRNPVTNKPIISDISVNDYNKIVNELQAMSPIFTSDEQTLEIGGFKTKIATDWPVMSSAMAGKDNKGIALNQKPLLKQPDDVGVKAIPFTVIGTGDAMMMNLIFGSDNAPMDVLGIFDGLDVPVTKLKDYAPMVNQKVLQSWDRDVLSMAVENFRGFLAQDLDKEVLDRAFARSKDKSKKSSVTASNPSELMVQLDQRLKANRARKAAIKKLPVSVDQMGGSDVGFSRGSGELSLNAINDFIQRELDGNPVKTVEELDQVDVITPVNETTVSAVISAVRWSEPQKKILNLIKPALGDTRVVYGTLEQLNSYRRENFPDSGDILTAPAQFDAVNDVVFMTTSKPESMLHELVHVATFKKVEDHYNGQTSDAVTRLEVLMNEFLEIKNGGNKVREAQASILLLKSKTDSFSKAGAVNELMAYVLGNAAVRRKAKETKSNSFSALADKVINLMRRLLGGVPSSIFDGVAFNTQVLISPPIEEGTTGGNGDGGGNNSSGDLTPPANNYRNYWIQQLADYLNVSSNILKTIRKDEQTKVRAAVNKIVDDLRQVGMMQSDEARATFKAIYGVINSEITLNPQALIGITNVFEHIVDNMTPEMFSSGSEGAQEYSAVLNAFGGRDRNMINSISVLLALSQTSQKFRDVLDQIPDPETNTGSRSLQDTLTTIASAMMTNITGSLETSGNAKDVMDMLAATIIDHDLESEYKVLKHVTSGLDAADAYVSGMMQNVAGAMRKTDAEMKASTRSKTVKHLTSLVTFGTNFLDRPGTDTTAQVVKDQVHMGLPVFSLIPVRELVAEMVGTDRFNKNLVALQDKVNAAISGMRQAYREDLPGIFAKLFNEKPTEEQWKAMYNILGKTDFTSIVDPDNITDSMKYLTDSTKRNRRIRTLESQIESKTVPYVAQDAKDKAEQLANFMTKGGVGKLLIRNAYAIAKNLDGNFDESLVPLLDELTTLYAVDMMNADERQDVVDMYNENPTAIDQIITYMQGLNLAEDSKPNISELARLNAYKGYIPNESRGNVRIIVAEDANELALKTRGFKKVKPFTGHPGALIDRSYYVSNTRTGGEYSQGILQNVAATYRGVDVNTGLSVNGATTGYISGDGVVNRMIQTIQEPSFDLEEEKETVIPVFAEDGTVAGFEYALNFDVVDKFDDKEENLAVMLGAWAGRHVEETTAYAYNVALIDQLDAIWQSREKGTDNLYVNLKTTKDPIYRESFNLIPQNVKAYIDTKFEGEGLWVRKDQANLSVGYREASLADMWTGKTRMPKEVQKAVTATTQLIMGRNAMKWVVQSEDVLQGVVSTAKDIIVIKSLVVPALNMQANVAHLAAIGVPMKGIVKGFRGKLAEVEKFNDNVTKIIELKALRDLRSRDANQKKILEDKIKVLEDLNRKMSIAPMIEAGAYKQLSEGMTEFDRSFTSGKLGDYMENVVAKLPDGVRTIGEYGIVSKSTKVYQVANRATQYGDFLAKSIYYDHLIKKGLDPDAAVAVINEEFVNFSTQPGRVRSALERNGLTWFMAFKLRIAKIAMKQMRDNPVRALAVNTLTDVGSPISDNIFSVMVDGRLDYATGYEMLFDAPELNPWVNLMNR